MRHLGPPAPTPPRAPGPLAFSDPDYVRGFLRDAGFAAIEIVRETIEIAGASAEEEAEHAAVMGPPGRLIDEKRPDPALRQRILREMVAAYAAYAENGKLRLPAAVNLVAARCPD